MVKYYGSLSLFLCGFCRGAGSYPAPCYYSVAFYLSNKPAEIGDATFTSATIGQSGSFISGTSLATGRS